MTVRLIWLGWAVLVLGVVAALVALPTPEGRADIVRDPEQPSWALPAMAPPNPLDEAALQKLATTPMWGPRAARPVSAEAAASASAPQPVWQITGSYLALGQRRVVLTDERRERPSQSLGVGEALPDGRRIVQIEADKVQLQVGKGRRAQLLWVPINRGLPVP